MTIILTIITKDFSITASDSKISPIGKSNDSPKPKNKTIHVPIFNGVLSYCGLASVSEWNTYNWLMEKSQLASNFSKPVDFVQYLCTELNKLFRPRNYYKEMKMGIIIHFACYEKICDDWIPEVYTIRNCDPLRPSIFHWKGFTKHPNCFSCLPREISKRYEWAKYEKQKVVFQDYLDKGNIQILFNGERPLFTTYFDQFYEKNFQTIEDQTREGSEKYYVTMAEWIINSISDFQATYFVKEKITVATPVNIIVCRKA